MSMLWLAIVCLLVLALAFIVIPFFITFTRNEIQRDKANVAIHKGQLAELESDKVAGRITEAGYVAQSTEIKRNLLSDTQLLNGTHENTQPGRFLIPFLVLLTLVSSFLIYQQLGAANKVAISELLQLSYSNDFSKDDSQALLEHLDIQAQKDPEDVENWYLMGRMNFDLGHYEQAVVAFNGVLLNLTIDAKEDQAVAMAHLAQAQFFANGRTLDKSTRSLLDATLKINPQESTALGLLGVAAYDSGDFVNAVNYWQRLLLLMPASNPNAIAIAGGIEKARSQLTPEQLKTLQANEPANIAASIEVTVDIAEGLRSQIPKDADLFILAKASSGPPMPLAVKRLSVNKWPVKITLDDSMAMMPSLKMSNFEKVVITARISLSGVGNAKPGDMEGNSPVIDVNLSNTRVSIDKILK